VRCLWLLWLVGVPGFPAADMDPGRTNPYAIIWQRNSFGLKAPPVLVVVKPEAPVPVVKITLTGFVTLSDQRRATFMRQVDGGVPLLFSLAEGEKNDAVELVRIDERKDAVVIRQAGEETTLTFSSILPPAAPVTSPPAVPAPALANPK
jgi:hypothetical protein